MREDLPGQMELPIVETDLRAVVGLLTPKELAEAIGVAEQTLAGWRCTGKGPDFVKLGKGVFYRLVDVKAWVSSNVTSMVVEPTYGAPAVE